MENKLVAPEINKDVVEKKRHAWSQMGEAIYMKEMNLQAHAQYALLKVKHPVSIEEVPLAESLLKELKADQRAIEASRKEITSKFEDVSKRLMEPEKSLINPIVELDNAIVLIKKEYEIKKVIQNNKIEESKRIREWLSIKKVELDAHYKSMITQKVNAAYEYALGDGNIIPENLDTYLEKVLCKLNEENFTSVRLNPVRKHITIEEVESIIDEIGSLNPSDYVALYAIELEKRFSDYDIAFTQKADAIRIAQEESKKRLQAIQEEESNKTISVQLDSASSDFTIEKVPIKPLKKSYEVDMPETVETVIKIMGAFTANMSVCLPKLKVNKWFAFTPAQAANVLGKCKNDDNSFQPSGIIFKEVDKL